MRTIITDHAKLRYMQRKNPQSRPEEEIPKLFEESREIKWELRRNNAKHNPEHNLVFAYKKEKGKTVIVTVLRMNEDEVEYKDNQKTGKPEQVDYPA